MAGRSSCLRTTTRSISPSVTSGRQNGSLVLALLSLGQCCMGVHIWGWLVCICLGCCFFFFFFFFSWVFLLGGWFCCRFLLLLFFYYFRAYIHIKVQTHCPGLTPQVSGLSV